MTEKQNYTEYSEILDKLYESSKFHYSIVFVEETTGTLTRGCYTREGGAGADQRGDATGKAWWTVKECGGSCEESEGLYQKDWREPSRAGEL
ncbi:hypothetical protein NPIL_319531 [Nephila pilipes]|uniref:Uncharacterized protein n=1 Tax=Nephila pilipes TaxID=299642 RepID=A0A8X6U4Y0_NEPPI|nr:hypothetical protein NPIL_319531 [Nephila pilipes]